jgi:Cu+-exporting ATPase
VTLVLPVIAPKTRRSPSDARTVLAAAAAVEAGSIHPLAEAIARTGRERCGALPAPIELEETPGQGIEATVEGQRVLVGNRAFCQSHGVDPAPFSAAVAQMESTGATAVLVALDGRPAGVIGVADPARPDTGETVAALQARGISVWMSSGDTPAVALAIAEQVGIPADQVLAQMQPVEKAQLVQRLRKEGEVVAFVGDGTNDAPALAAADVGIAMGSGTQVAVEAASITLLQGSLPGVVRALELADRTMRIIRQNLVWAFGYNIVLIPLAILSPLLAVLTIYAPILAAGAMAFSSVTVVLNALRLRRFGR